MNAVCEMQVQELFGWVVFGGIGVLYILFFCLVEECRWVALGATAFIGLCYGATHLLRWLVC